MIKYIECENINYDIDEVCKAHRLYRLNDSGYTDRVQNRHDILRSDYLLLYFEDRLEFFEDCRAIWIQNDVRWEVEAKLELLDIIGMKHLRTVSIELRFIDLPSGYHHIRINDSIELFVGSIQTETEQHMRVYETIITKQGA